MRELKSIEKLQTLIKDNSDGYHIDIRGVEAEFETELFSIIGELQAEISERFMELPLDADGVPIHVGDKLLKSTGAPKQTYGVVAGISDDSVWFEYQNNGYESNWANLTSHVKPDPVKELLREFALEIDAGADVDCVGAKSIDEYAVKLRELLGGDAECAKRA